MSIELARKVLALDASPRPAHIEYTMNYDLMERVTGLPKSDAQQEAQFFQRWDFDLCWHTHDGPVPWDKAGRITNMGHAEFKADGSDMRASSASPFKSVEEVLAFDAVAEYGLTDADELAAFYQRDLDTARQRWPGTMVTAGYYHTLISGAILSFGWDNLLMAAADQSGFERVLDSFFRLSLHHYKAWARTDAEVFICHDDMVWSAGPFMHPDFYRRALFPRYRKLWAVLRSAGKKVLFCCDGNWTMFLGDAADAGADGFIFEPLTDFDVACREFGQSHVLVGSKVDCRTLTYGSREQIAGEIEASLVAGLGCPGWVAAVGNHIAPNVPVDNALFYFDYLSSRWRR